MELDFNTVKALSSRTRIKILNETLSSESTPTDLSKSVGKSKSTVSSHLKKLHKAGLLKKDEIEGRRRVVYKPTEKTKDIINGKNRKVKFSILSSVSTAWIGLGLGLTQFKQFISASSQAQSYSSDGGQMGAMTLSKSAETAAQSTESLSGQPEQALLFAGASFLSISVVGLIYGFVMSRLGR